MPHAQSSDFVLLSAGAEAVATHVLAAVYHYEEGHDEPLVTPGLVERVYREADLEYHGWYEQTARYVLQIADRLADEGKIVKYKRNEMYPSLLRRKMKKSTGRVPRWASPERDRKARAAIAEDRAEAMGFDERRERAIERAAGLGVVADRCPGGVFLSLGGLEEVLNRLSAKKE